MIFVFLSATFNRTVCTDDRASPGLGGKLDICIMHVYSAHISRFTSFYPNSNWFIYLFIPLPVADLETSSNLCWRNSGLFDVRKWHRRQFKYVHALMRLNGADMSKQHSWQYSRFYLWSYILTLFFLFFFLLPPLGRGWRRAGNNSSLLH